MLSAGISTCTVGIRGCPSMAAAVADRGALVSRDKNGGLWATSGGALDKGEDHITHLGGIGAGRRGEGDGRHRLSDGCQDVPCRPGQLPRAAHVRAKEKGRY